MDTDKRPGKMPAKSDPQIEIAVLVAMRRPLILTFSPEGEKGIALVPIAIEYESGHEQIGHSFLKPH
jgi:hypothetical protein